jgi:hypothetical protein
LPDAGDTVHHVALTAAVQAESLLTAMVYVPAAMVAAMLVLSTDSVGSVWDVGSSGCFCGSSGSGDPGSTHPANPTPTTIIPATTHLKYFIVFIIIISIILKSQFRQLKSPVFFKKKSTAFGGIPKPSPHRLTADAGRALPTSVY